MNEKLKEEISKLDSAEFLDLIQLECENRKVDRDKIKGGNDREINKINLLLTDNFWMTKVYIILCHGEYIDFVQDKQEAINSCERHTQYSYIEEIVDLRGIY